MNKISGIIPSSPRLQAVDLKDNPVRPGAPAFGRPEGVSSLRDQNNIPAFDTTTPMRAGNVHREMMNWREKDQMHAAMAAELSNRFFMKREPVQEAPAVDVTNGAGAYSGGVPVGLHAVASTPAGFKTNEVGSFEASIRPSSDYEDVMDADEEPIEIKQPEGLYPKGSFLDKTV